MNNTQKIILFVVIAVLVGGSAVIAIYYSQGDQTQGLAKLRKISKPVTVVEKTALPSQSLVPQPSVAVISNPDQDLVMEIKTSLMNNDGSCKDVEPRKIFDSKNSAGETYSLKKLKFNTLFTTASQNSNNGCAVLFANYYHRYPSDFKYFKKISDDLTLSRYSFKTEYTEHGLNVYDQSDNMKFSMEFDFQLADSYVSVSDLWNLYPGDVFAPKRVMQKGLEELKTSKNNFVIYFGEKERVLELVHKDDLFVDYM